MAHLQRLELSISRKVLFAWLGRRVVIVVALHLFHQHVVNMRQGRAFVFQKKLGYAS